MHHSGIDQREKKEICKDVVGIWDSRKIKEQILKCHEQAYELHESRDRKDVSSIDTHIKDKCSLWHT